MNRTVLTLFVCSLSAASVFAQMGNRNAPTLTKDVAPILQKKCQNDPRISPKDLLPEKKVVARSKTPI